jgi:hypothetical protein
MITLILKQKEVQIELNILVIFVPMKIPFIKMNSQIELLNIIKILINIAEKVL